MGPRSAACQISLKWFALSLLSLEICGPDRALAQRPLGIDVSQYQGSSINWSSVKASGRTFAWTKATEGVGYTDPVYLINAANAKAAGVYIGAYHFARPDLNLGVAGADAEAAYFWSVVSNYVKGGGFYMMPMLDIEQAPGASYSKATLSQWVNRWCSNVVNSAAAAGVVVKPLVYTYISYAGTWLDSTVTNWPLWMANYNGQDPQTGGPNGTSPWSAWNFWQYSSTGAIPGVPGNCDEDVFNGTTNTLATYIIGQGNSASVVSSSVPTGVLPGQTFSATITLNNDGTSTWTNTGVNAYKLGSQSPQDNVTWGTNRILMSSSPINPGQNISFTFNATAPGAAGSYTFAWRMVQEGVQWFGQTFSTTINVGNSAAVVSASVLPIVSIGQTFTASITMKNNGGTTWTNTGGNPYKLGSQSPQDNTTWGTNRASLLSSPINPGQNATFSISAKAPTSVGTFPFAWKMVQDPSNTFGATFTTNISVILSGPGITVGSYTIDTNMDSTSRNGSFVALSTCSLNGWYSYGVPGTSNCTVFNRDIRWMPALPTYGFSGRGYLTASMVVPGSSATATVKFFAVNAGGADLPGPITGTINECAYSCNSVTFFNGSIDVSSFGGWRSNTQDDSIPSGGGCNAACGTFPAGYTQVKMQGARWQYINDWTCLGGYNSSSVSDTSNRSFSEANLYLYPAVDSSHGGVIPSTMGLNGKTPGRVTTGDCNNANTLDYKGNANAYGGGDNMDAYGFAWVFTPGGASPRFVIGSDDGNRLWVNGILRIDNNATRSLIRDQDTTSALSLPAGWNRVLFKVHNFTDSFQGTVSLRNGTNANLNAPSMNVYDFGGYYSYGLGYEQDAWYPQIVVSNIYGSSSPVNGSVFYGNNTTVAVSGASNGQGPVPYWRTMQYQWGFGLGNADSDYADVSSTPTSTSWSHVTSGVIGHRRFYFFAVSQSGRTSFQNSGISGGSVFSDAGNYGRYYDFYVDNAPPQDPGFTGISAAGTAEIDLAWNIPLDQGVNIAPGSTESAGGSGNQDSQNWYRVGDVAVQVYRNGTAISSWGTSTALNDNGLVPNTAYTYTIEARDNNSGLRGPWNNSTGQQSSNTVWTFSVPPTGNSIVASQTNTVPGSTINWTAVGGFGPGTLQYYRYVWDQSPTHSFADTETQWSGGSIATTPTAGGNWYLHVKGYNGADVGNGTQDYLITVSDSQPQILSIDGATTGTVTITWSAVSNSTYRVQYNADLTPTNWIDLVPDVQATNNIASATDNTGGASQRFYRVMLLP